MPYLTDSYEEFTRRVSQNVDNILSFLLENIILKGIKLIINK